MGQGLDPRRDSLFGRLLSMSSGGAAGGPRPAAPSEMSGGPQAAGRRDRAGRPLRKEEHRRGTGSGRRAFRPDRGRGGDRPRRPRAAIRASGASPIIIIMPETGPGGPGGSGSGSGGRPIPARAARTDAGRRSRTPTSVAVCGRDSPGPGCGCHGSGRPRYVQRIARIHRPGVMPKRNAPRLRREDCRVRATSASRMA
jgi:hypothetical protein